MAALKRVLAATVAGFLSVTPAIAQTNDGPPPLPVTNVEVWYAENGQRRGPVSLDQLRQLVRAGVVTKQTLVWRKGMANWAAAGTVDGMAVLFIPTDGPPQLPGADWGKFMQGTWTTESKYQQIYAQANTTYRADGTLTGTANYFGDDTLNPGQRILIGTNHYEGTWLVKPMTGERFQLVLKYTRFTNPTLKLPLEPLALVMQRTGANSVYNETQKVQGRRVQ